MKSLRNKTIDIDIDSKEGERLLSKCLEPTPYWDEFSFEDRIEYLSNTTINGDTFYTLQYIPNETINLVISDPPYELRKKYEDMTFNPLPEQDYLKYTHRWLDECYRILKPNGSIYICIDWTASHLIRQCLVECGFTIKNRITWGRDKGRGAKSNWKNNSEDIWYATKNKTDYIFNLDDVKIEKKVIAPYRKDGIPKDWKENEDGTKTRLTCPSNFWTDIVVPFWSMPENTIHSTQKPESLISRLILASSNPGDIILDPFVGSGTTSVVAKRLNRNYIGIEMQKKYCAITEYRLENNL